MEIKRTREIKMMKERLRGNPIVAILGARQCGKTTLAKQFARGFSPKKIHFFDLEDPEDLLRLDNPMLTLEGLKGFVIIDEIQRRPELFPILRVLADRSSRAKYIILGSASRELISQSSESLAGRISYIEMGGFLLGHIQKKEIKKLWIRGNFPRSFLVRNESASFQWRKDFITTFLERDVPNLGLQIPARTLRRFWMMLVHYHGQIFNASEIGKSLSINYHTARRYLDILSGTFLIRQLNPWYYNTKKRLVKRPKLYFRDSGILHTMLSLENQRDVMTHPKLGASWEGFALEQTIKYLNLNETECFFWGVHTGAELDMVFSRKGKMWGIEVKYKEAPERTRSMMSALKELQLAHLWVIYPGRKLILLDKKITAIPLQKLNSIENFWEKGNGGSVIKL